MVVSFVSPQQRYNNYHRCPICDGHANMPQGKGIRCAGFLSQDGEYAYCTREEKAGSLELNYDVSPAAYLHKMHGPCNCGVQHGADLSIVPPSKLRKEASSMRKNDSNRRVVNEYTYYDRTGRVAYQALRYEPKDFNQRRPDGNGGWAYNLQGVERIPYRLPELLKASPDALVYIVEGEKDADNLAHIGMVATTNVGGAGNWQASCNQYLKGRHAIILPDNDDKGWKHAEKVKQELTGIAASVKIVELPNLPDKGDVSDWLAAGGTREKLEAMCKPPKRKFTYASQVEEKAIEWIWQNRIARGSFTLAVGDAGVGKGLTISAIIKKVTRGEWGAPGGVILMSPEDSASQTIVPRLKAAGADCDKVLLLSEVDEADPTTGEIYQRPVSFPEDAHILREAIEDAGAVLVVIDPVLSLLSGKVDAHKNHAVRQALAQVMSTAEKHNAAVLGVMHTTKSAHPNVLFRSSSSSAFIEMARTALFFVPDPDGEQGQSGVIVNHKNNLAKHADSIRYSIHHNERNIGFIEWEGVSTYSRDELLNQSTPTNNRKSESEDSIISVLKFNGEAMTPKQVASEVNQDLEAVKKMLQRKADSGIIWRTERGKYTYVGNSLYKNDVPDVPSVPDVPNVPNVPKDERDMKGTYVPNESGNGAATDAASRQRDIRDINKQQQLSLLHALPSDNGNNGAPQADSFKVGQFVRCPDGQTGEVKHVNKLSIDVQVYGTTRHYTADQFKFMKA